jgi:hypothetical protein
MRGLPREREGDRAACTAGARHAAWRHASAISRAPAGARVREDPVETPIDRET